VNGIDPRGRSFVCGVFGVIPGSTYGDVFEALFGLVLSITEDAYAAVSVPIGLIVSGGCSADTSYNTDYPSGGQSPYMDPGGVPLDPSYS
jgi:hypothetical protein